MSKIQGFFCQDGVSNITSRGDEPSQTLKKIVLRFGLVSVVTLGFANF